MTMVLTEAQNLLKDTARDFIQSKAPVAALRQLREYYKDLPEGSCNAAAIELGYSQELWEQMSELGWAGIVIPEAYGGLEFGYQGLGVVLEECGRTLAASPLFATVALGAGCIQEIGSDEQKQTLLPEVAEGRTTLALALEEHPRHTPTRIATCAEATDDGYTLKGFKTFVLDGHCADQLVVVARTSGGIEESEGISLFLVDANAPGVRRSRTAMLDSRNVARIVFDNVRLKSEALIGMEGQGYPALETVLDRARILLAAEMLGGVQECFERTIEYLKEREQFGTKIGSFQALQHRAAKMLTEVELSQAAVMAALSALDENSSNVRLLASLVKARLNDTFELVTNEAVQMHGGMGVTDELDIGLFLKRARVTMQILGDSSYHRDRYATLSGY